jgi:hypothetical protein
MKYGDIWEVAVYTKGSLAWCLHHPDDALQGTYAILFFSSYDGCCSYGALTVDVKFACFLEFARCITVSNLNLSSREIGVNRGIKS